MTNYIVCLGTLGRLLKQDLKICILKENLNNFSYNRKQWVYISQISQSNLPL